MLVTHLFKRPFIGAIYQFHPSLKSFLLICFSGDLLGRGDGVIGAGNTQTVRSITTKTAAVLTVKFLCLLPQKLTAKAPENKPGPKKGKACLSTTNFDNVLLVTYC